VRVSGGSGGLKNTRITEGTQWFILVWTTGALRPAVDDPYTLEHPKSGGLQQSVRERFGRGSLGVDSRLIDGEVSSSSERRKTMERVEELSVLL